MLTKRDSNTLTLTLPAYLRYLPVRYYMMDVIASGCQAIELQSGQSATPQRLPITQRKRAKRIVSIERYSKSITLKLIDPDTEFHLKHIKFVPLLPQRVYTLIEKKNQGVRFSTDLPSNTKEAFKAYNRWHLKKSGLSHKTQPSNFTKEACHTFGFTFIGPLLGYFFYWLGQKPLSQTQTLFFLAREGYFLKTAYDHIQAEHPWFNLKAGSSYLLCSRALLFKLTLITKEGLQSSLKHPYGGSLLDFLKTRYQFTHEELFTLKNASPILEARQYDYIELPKDATLINEFCREAKTVLDAIIMPKQQRYLSYLNSIGFTRETPAQVIDLGYAGTIQTQLSKLTGQATHGHYFIATHANKSNNKLHFSGCFAENIGFKDGISLMDRSFYLEALLTSPTGMAVDIIEKNGKPHFLYGIETQAQLHFPRLEYVIEGAMDYIDSLDDPIQLLTKEEALAHYDRLSQQDKQLIPQALKDILYIDHSLSGFGVVNACEVL